MEKTILENLNKNEPIECNSSDKEIIYNHYVQYITKLIIAFEKLLFEMFESHEKLSLQNLAEDENEDLILHYSKFYFTKYITNLKNKSYTELDMFYYEKNISNVDIIEELINLSYPNLTRSELNVYNLQNYCESINEQLEEILQIYKLDIIKKL